MKRLLFVSLLLAACSPAAPPVATPAPLTPTPAAVATPAPVAAQEEDIGPPLPIVQHSPAGNPREGLEKASRLPGYAQVAKLTGNPVPWEPASVMEGQMLYRANCSSCHCWDGDGDGPASPGMQPPPRNFSQLKAYKYGTGELALFRTARYGIPNSPMVPAAAEISDEQLWKVVHFVRTLQPPSRPSEVIIDLQGKESSCLRGGFHDGEDSETESYAWSDGPASRFEFKLYPRQGPYRLSVRAKKIPSLPRVAVTAELNGKKLGTLEYTLPVYESPELLIAPGTLKAGVNRLVLKYAQQAALPDGRTSSLAVDYLWVTPGSP